MLRLALPPTANTRGVFTREEAEAVGWTAKSVRRLLTTGTWVELHRSAYVDAVQWNASTPWERHRLVAVATALGQRVVVAGASAACVHGPSVLGVEGPATLLRAGDVPTDHVTRVADVLVTSPTRTVVDCARRHGVEAGVVVADSALRLGAATLPALRALVTQGRRWTSIGDAAAAVEFADARAESPLESVSRVRFAQLGLPMADIQVVIEVGPGEQYRVDFYWEAQRTIGEADGMIKYSDPAVLRAEKYRELVLHEAGFEVVRWMWDEIWRTPDIVIERVRRTFARAGTRFGR